MVVLVSRPLRAPVILILSQEKILMKIVNTVLVVAALSFVGAVSAPGARADQYNKKTVMTFNQAVEIPGQILPAGTYTFKLLDSRSDRHIVQVFNADGTQLIATILTINDYRLQPTGRTVVKFAEQPGDAPDALKAWFYPGDNFGQEFVYPKQRATELAVAIKEPVPALPADSTDLNTVAIVAITPEQREVPVTEAVQTTAPVADDPAPAPAVATAELPKTASAQPLYALLGLASLLAALLAKRLA
jgi:LPXTG-motif cell wall-anchored protein